MLNEKYILESKISNLNKNKEKLSKDLKKLEEQISLKKEILEKMKEDEKNMKIQKQNNIINNKPQENQSMKQNAGNNQINKNNNNPPLINDSLKNNMLGSNQIINQNQNNQIKKLKEPEPISIYKQPTLIGLNNIGSTCYKNSVLQCLSQTRGLTNYFLKEKNYDRIMNTNISKQDPNQIQLCHIYYDLIQNLWKKNSTFKSFSPNEFMNSIAKMTQNDQVQFSLYEVEDAKDFIIYILERMHNELKQPLKHKFWKIEPKDQPLNQYDKNNAFIHFLDEFQNETSIISDLFYGFNEISK